MPYPIQLKPGHYHHSPFKLYTVRKVLATFSAALLLLSSCKKDIKAPESINAETISSEGAIVTDPCHATAFSTNYATVAGKFPPFKFTKTQYASGKIKTINMISRANPNHSAFKQQAWEVIGTFTYFSNKAQLKGTKQLWEYSKSSTGAAIKKSILKKNIDLTFSFGTQPYNDYGGTMDGTAYNKVYEVRNNLEGKLALRMKRNSYSTWEEGTLFIEVLAGSDEPDNYFEATAKYPDGNLSSITITSHNVTQRAMPKSWGLRKTITFKYNPSYYFEPERQRFYQPTQNWISMEYNLCEVMNWIGFGGLDGSGYGGERNFVEVKFYPYNTSSLSVQSQVYKNHRYGGNNLLSYTYGDNVLQKSTWICK